MESVFVCPVCFNLDPDRCPEKSPPSLLDEHRLNVPFSELKRSAETGDCLACKILCVGLENMQELWDEGAESENGDQILLDETLLHIDLRRDHSLRVILANVGYETTIEFYTVSIDDCGLIPAFGIARPVSSELEISECLALATEWLKECSEKHHSCGQPTESKLPTRVLDVGQIDTDIVYLHETKDSDRGCYMTLSHCWGKEQIITTTTGTLQDRKAGVKLSQLSKTFRHAVQITRGLGIRYLWIDSLCIIQDDKLDWEVESAKMAQVYMSSQLNLAATHSSSGKEGCFGERWSLDTLNQTELNVGEDVAIEPSDETEGNYKIFYRHALHVAHDHFTRTMDYANTMEDLSPLLSRAWVFQERLLSPRTLHFHAEELIWECASGISCECSRLQNHKWGDPDGLLEQRKVDQLKMMYSSITSPEMTDPQVLETWLEFVTEYCTLKLTKQMDRLPALSGLASRVAQRLQSSEYLAGLWSQDLPRALCWQIDGPYYGNRHPTFRDAHPSAPSWSWASIWNNSQDAPYVTYGLVQTRGFVPDLRCRIQSFHKSQSTISPFGICGVVQLSIQAPLIEATLLVTEQDDSSIIDQMRKGSAHEQSLIKIKEKMSETYETWVRFEGESVRISPDCFDIKQRITDISHGDAVFCLLLGHFTLSDRDWMGQHPSQHLTRKEKLESEESSSQLLGAYALVLRKVDDGPTYRRLGLLVHRRGAGWWEDAPIALVTLI
ncbi:hypothetical protein LHYA1_G001152 [Lachnellula hyalina]|uniref:Heterokaryon incompatibility domain-containing protein n=1 Tax=Lachnellula hyalina TaxID=1316788 RepID=A0A8H8R8S4_9HELO|nr:uncharacterized protein LHYA1_G001152 [Lachnellula hyalina]TVY30660.1 hypothetical protein LHYA1_G001152 [Lachnellula hyalina]